MKTFTLTVTANDLETMSDLDDTVQELLGFVDSGVVLTFNEAQRGQVLKHLRQDGFDAQGLRHPAKNAKDLPLWGGVELITGERGNLSFKHDRKSNG